MTEPEYGYMKTKSDGNLMMTTLRVNPIILHQWEKELGRKVVRVRIVEVPHD